MPVGFDELQIGKKYERSYLAKIWGYKSICSMLRDKVAQRELIEKGWHVLTIWQCEINSV